MTSDHVGIGIGRRQPDRRSACGGFQPRLPRATLRAVASRSAGRAAEFAGRWGIPIWLTDFRELADRPEVNVVCIAAPQETGADGRAVLELIYAAYRAARIGRVELPLELSEQEAAQPPFALW